MSQQGPNMATRVAMDAQRNAQTRIVQNNIQRASAYRAASNATQIQRQMSRIQTGVFQRQVSQLQNGAARRIASSPQALQQAAEQSRRVEIANQAARAYQAQQAMRAQTASQQVAQQTAARAQTTSQQAVQQSAKQQQAVRQENLIREQRARELQRIMHARRVAAGRAIATRMRDVLNVRVLGNAGNPPGARIINTTNPVNSLRQNSLPIKTVGVQQNNRSVISNPPQDTNRIQIKIPPRLPGQTTQERVALLQKNYKEQIQKHQAQSIAEAKARMTPLQAAKAELSRDSTLDIKTRVANAQATYKEALAKNPEVIKAKAAKAELERVSKLDVKTRVAIAQAKFKAAQAEQIRKSLPPKAAISSKVTQPTSSVKANPIVAKEPVKTVSKVKAPKVAQVKAKATKAVVVKSKAVSQNKTKAVKPASAKIDTPPLLFQGVGRVTRSATRNAAAGTVHQQHGKGGHQNGSGHDDGNGSGSDGEDSGSDTEEGREVSLSVESQVKKRASTKEQDATHKNPPPLLFKGVGKQGAPIADKLTKKKLVNYLQNIDDVPREQLKRDVESIGLKYAGGSPDAGIVKFTHRSKDYRVEMHEAHLKRKNGAKYEHIHIRDKQGNSLDKNLKRVDSNSPEAHIKIKSFYKIIVENKVVCKK